YGMVAVQGQREGTAVAGVFLIIVVTDPIDSAFPAFEPGRIQRSPDPVFKRIDKMPLYLVDRVLGQYVVAEQLVIVGEKGSRAGQLQGHLPHTLGHPEFRLE